MANAASLAIDKSLQRPLETNVSPPTPVPITALILEADPHTSNCLKRPASCARGLIRTQLTYTAR